MKDNPLEINSFRDLKCWQEGKELFLSLASHIGDDVNLPPAENILCQDLLRAASSICGSIASSFSRSNLNNLRECLQASLGECRRIASLITLAYGRRLLGESDINDLESRLASLASSLKEHLKYLMNIEVKERYREMEEL